MGAALAVGAVLTDDVSQPTKVLGQDALPRGCRQICEATSLHGPKVGDTQPVHCGRKLLQSVWPVGHSDPEVNAVHRLRLLACRAASLTHGPTVPTSQFPQAETGGGAIVGASVA